MGSLPFFTNAFGFDRSGFCVLVLSLVPRSEILLGKNIAILPPFLLLTALPLLGIQLLAHPPVLYTISAFLQALTLCLLLTRFGNFLSIKAPYRSKPGSLQPVKTKSGASALMNTLFPFLFLLSPYSDNTAIAYGRIIPVDSIFSISLEHHTFRTELACCRLFLSSIAPFHGKSSGFPRAGNPPHHHRTSRLKAKKLQIPQE